MLMTTDKAIEILRLDSLGAFDGDPADLAEAKQRGIEALERICDIRQYKTLIGMAVSMPGRPLPSETKTQLERGAHA